MQDQIRTRRKKPFSREQKEPVFAMKHDRIPSPAGTQDKRLTVEEGAIPGRGSATLHQGRILVASDDGWIVTMDPPMSSSIFATTAFSCLVEPTPGDRVLVALDKEGESGLVLAICERPSTVPARLALQGKLVMSSTDTLELHGRNVRIRSDAELALDASSMQAVADRATLSVREAGIVAQCLRSVAAKASLVAEGLTQVVGTLTQKLTHSQRLVREREEVFAGSSLTSARDLVSIQGQNARINAERHIVVNADKIHMG